VCEIERDRGRKTKKHIGRVGEGESATHFNLLFICVSMAFPLFFGWKDAWRKGVGDKKREGREVRDREFLSFLLL
jgi:hypothetical protein